MRIWDRQRWRALGCARLGAVVVVSLSLAAFLGCGVGEKFTPAEIEFVEEATDSLAKFAEELDKHNEKVHSGTWRRTDGSGNAGYYLNDYRNALNRIPEAKFTSLASSDRKGFGRLTQWKVRLHPLIPRMMFGEPLDSEAEKIWSDVEAVQNWLDARA